MNTSTSFRYFFLLILFIALPVYSQIQVTQQEFLKVITANSYHYFTERAEGVYDLGKAGGPNVYDFRFINLQNLNISNNYEVSTIPVLAARYPGSSVTFGESPGTVEKNPVFYISNDSVFVIGHASLIPEYKFSHYRPYELIGKFPLNFGAGHTQTIDIYDTTYNNNWQVTDAEKGSGREISLIDGFGTLKLSSGDYECLRIKREYPDWGDKEFMYITREGCYLMIGLINISDPDTGSVQTEMQLLLATSIVGLNDAELKIDEYKLEQNYPNPFNPATNFEFRIADFGLVTLKVYDVIGREVATLINEEKPAGTYEINWKAAGLPSGVYFYRINAGEFFTTKKMTLIK